MRELVHLALKDLRILWRDRLAAFFALVFPLALAIFFGSLFGGGEEGQSEVTLAVSDLDGTDASAEFVAALDSAETLAVRSLPTSEARDAVRRGELPAYLEVREGFGEAVQSFGVSDAVLRLGVDPALPATSAAVEGVITRAWFSRIQQQIQDPGALREQLTRASEDGQEGVEGLPDDQADLLLGILDDLALFQSQIDTMEADAGPAFGDPPMESVSVTGPQIWPRSPFAISFPSAVLWGILACVATFATSIVRERRSGTWFRLRVAPLTRGHILGGKALACFVAAVVIAAVLMAIASVVFGVQVDSWGLLGLAIAAVGVGFVGIMMLLSSLGRSEQAVSGASWAAILIMAMLGGGMVPLIAMPEWLTSLSRVSPVRWGILALEGSIWRGFSAAEMLAPVAVLLGTGLVCFLAGVALLRRREG